MCVFVCYEVSPGAGCCGGRLPGLPGLPRCMSCGWEIAEFLNLHNEYSTDMPGHPRKMTSEARCTFLSRARNSIASMCFSVQHLIKSIVGTIIRVDHL